MDMITTLRGSLLENFYPAGWDLERLQACCSHKKHEALDRQPFWNPQFFPVSCKSLEHFNMMMGHEIAKQIARARAHGELLGMILPVGPIGIYEWTVYRSEERRVGKECL